MAKISIYSPSITVPVVPAAKMRANQTGLVIADQAARVYEAYDQKQREDARVTLATERIKADHKFTTEYLSAKDEGRIDDAFPQSMIDGVKGYFTQLREQYAGNKYMLDGIELLEAEQGASHLERAIVGAAEVRSVKRFAKVGEAFDLGTSMLVRDPTKYSLVERSLKDAVAGLTDPQQKVRGEELVRNLAPSMIEGMLQSENLADTERAIALMKGGALEGKISGSDLTTMLNRADSRKRELQNQNFLSWQAQQQKDASEGRKTGLPDPAIVGPDNVNRATMTLYNPMSEADAKRLEAKETVIARLGSGMGISPTDKREVEGANVLFDEYITNETANELGTDELGNIKGTPAQIAAVKDAAILKVGPLLSSQLNYVPASVNNYLTRAVRSKDQASFTQGLELYRQLVGPKGGGLKPDLSDQDLRVYNDVMVLMNKGRPLEEAVTSVMANRSTATQQGQQTIDDLRSEFTKLNSGAVKGSAPGQKIDATDAFINDQIGGNVEYDANFRVEVRREAMRQFVEDGGKSLDAAISTAFQNVSETYKGSFVNVEVGTAQYTITPQNPFRSTDPNKQPNPFLDSRPIEARGSAQMMKNPPEFIFGVPKATQAENAKWIQDQALEVANKYAPAGKKFEAFAGQIKMMPAPENRWVNGKPSYTLQYKDAAGGWQFIKSPTNKTEPYYHVPDSSKSSGAGLLADKYNKQEIINRNAAEIYRANQKDKYERAKKGQRPLGGYQ